LLVAQEALEGALSSPAAITVHDDGDVLGNFVGVELPVDALLLGREFVYPAGGGWAQSYLAVRDALHTDASIPRWGVQ
jgi:hypothetical protein